MMDYRKLGEVWGEAWKVSHPNASETESQQAAQQATKVLPHGAREAFHEGWRKAVDEALGKGGKD